jgi:transcriptional regulator with XRE-family HTH domain
MKAREILARNVRRLRAERGLSQEKLGFEAKVSMTSISHIETERYAATVDVIGRIATALKVPIHELLVENVGAQQGKK